MRSTFDFALAVSPVQKIELAEDLVDLANDPKTKPTEQYVFLTTARDLTKEAGDIPAAVKYVEQLATAFDVDSLRAEYELLTQAAAEYKQSEDIESLAGAMPDFISRALAANRIDLAGTVADDVYKATLVRGVATPVRKAAFDEKKRLAELSENWERIGGAIEDLEADPENPEKNLIAGNWFCFSQQNWDRGLTYLAKSNDPMLQPLAKQELESNGSAATLIAIGDGWRKAAAEATGDTKLAMRDRSVRAYLLAQAAAPEGSDEATKLNLVFKALGDVSKTRAALIREKQPAGKKILFISFGGPERKTAEAACQRYFLAADFGGKFDLNHTDFSEYHTIMVGSNGMDFWGNADRKEPEAFQHYERFIREGGHFIAFGTYNGRNFHQLRRFGVTTGFNHGTHYERTGEATDLFFRGVEHLAPENNKMRSAGNFSVSTPHTVLLKRASDARAGKPALATIPVDDGRVTVTMCEPNWQGDLWLIKVVTAWVSNGAPIPKELPHP